MSNTRLWFCLTLCLLVISANVVCGASVAAVPSAESIAAEMLKQDTVTLDVTYSVSFLNVQPDNHSNKDAASVHYIRTPEASYVKWVLNAGMQLVDECSYDRQDNRCISKTTQKSGRSSGIICTGLSAALARQDLLETVRFPLYSNMDLSKGPLLYDWIKYGKVSEKQEKIDGALCWRVDISGMGNPNQIQKCSVWVDSSIGYCPRRVGIKRTNGKTSQYSFLNYSEIAKGIWFPKKYVISNNEDAYQLVSQVTEASAIPGVGKFTRDALRVKFPSGAKIYMQDTGKMVVEP